MQKSSPPPTKNKIHKETREDDQIQRIKTNIQKPIVKKQTSLTFFIKKQNTCFKETQ